MLNGATKERLKCFNKSLLAMGSGALLPFAFAPYNLPFMVAVSLLMLLYLLRAIPPKKAAGIGYWFGLGYFGHGVYWVYFSIHHFGHAPLWLSIIIMLGMVAILAGYMAVLSYVLNRFFAGENATRYLLAFPSLWLGLEALRGVLFTGFPWLSLGYSQIDTWLSGWAPVFGVLGLTYLVSLSIGCIAYLLFGVSRRFKKHGVVILLACWLSGAGLTSIDWVKSVGEPLSVVLLQGNIPQEVKWLRSFYEINNSIYMEMTRQHVEADVIVWPETAIPGFYHGVKETLITDLKSIVDENDTDIVVGLPIMLDGASGYYNGLHSVKSEDAFYLKRHLVPLGEYMPLKPLSTFILDFLQIPLSDFSAGNASQPLLHAGGYGFASSICYEDAFQQTSIDGLPDAAYLINVSNDTWFGDTIAPYQHFQMARMRALESGRYMLRATNTGLTAIINQRGDVIHQAPMFKRFSLKGDVLPLMGETPFVMFGWWLMLVFAIIMPIISLIRGVR